MSKKLKKNIVWIVAIILMAAGLILFLFNYLAGIFPLLAGFFILRLFSFQDMTKRKNNNYLKNKK